MKPGFSTCLFITVGALLAISSDARAQPSTFQHSCSEISITGATLHARCARRNGRPHWTQLELRGIENIDGNLRARRHGPSSFQNSCRRIRVHGPMLTASCQRRDGSWQHTSLVIQNVENIDGHLRYARR